MFLLCVVCWLSVAFSWPLTASPLDERMCCVNVSALLGIARLSEDEFEIVECESTVLTTLMNRTYGLVFGLESRLVARRKADEHSLVLTLFDETVTSRLSTSWESGVRRNGVVVCLYNVWHYTSPYRARLAKIAALLKEKDCDVILLQEVRMKWSFYGTSFLIDDLMRLMPASFSFAFTPAMAYLSSHTFEMEGLALLSRFPVQTVRSVELSNAASKDPDDGHHRMLMIARVHLGESTMEFFNTHMSLSGSARIRNGMEVLRKMNEDPDTAQFLGGDLNAEPDDPLIQLLLSQLSDVGSCGPTFQTWNLTKRIDFALTRRLEKANLRVVSAETFGFSAKEETSPSDHLALRVEFAINQQKDEL